VFWRFYAQGSIIGTIRRLLHGAGKTTLTEELHRRLPVAVVYDPEDVGLMLWKWIVR
jgi:deoxyadenosine/deoxycytidine kinase